MQDDDTPEGASATSPDLALFQMMYGFMPSRLVYGAARLGIADHLHEGANANGELARKVGAEEHALRRVMRGLVNIGVFVEDEDGRFGLTPTGEFRLRMMPSGHFFLHSAYPTILQAITCDFAPLLKAYG